MNKVWIHPEFNAAKEKVFEELRWNPKLSLIPDNSLRILINKGITDASEIQDLLIGGLEQLYDFKLMKGAREAMVILIEAIRNRDLIVCMADYDMDGIGASSVVTKGFRMLDANIQHHANNRFVEGYGLKPESIDVILERFPDTKIILTVDNGISAFEGVRYAKEKGLIVIVTDHHEVSEELPVADVIVNPKQKDCEYPFKELCGAGIAFKLVIALALELGYPMDEFYDLVDIAALSTVGDLVPLVSENRIIVREGLKRVREGKRSFFRKMKQIAEVDVPNEETFGFQYVPMINAHGRLAGEEIEGITKDDPRYMEIWYKGTTMPIVDTIISDDEVYQEAMINYLKNINAYRKEKTKEHDLLAAPLAKNQEHLPIIIIKHQDFHPGLVGLVSGHLKEEYYRPTIVLSEREGLIHGSARSINGFPIKEMFDKCSEFLDGYGGHAAAGGLNIKKGCYEGFVKRMNELAFEYLNEDLLTEKIKIDIDVTTNQIDFQLIEELDFLRPYGMGFPKPILALNDMNLISKDVIGKNQNTTKILSYSDNEKTIETVIFGLPHYSQERLDQRKISILGYPSINTYGGVKVQFMGSRIK